MLAGVGLDEVDPADALADGRAMDVWRRMIAAQGGDPARRSARSRGSGTWSRRLRPACSSRLDALAVGVAAWRLGAGRARKEDPVSAGAGVVMMAKPGDTVRAGEPLLELRTDEAAKFERALAALDGGIEIGDHSPEPLVIDRIS